LPIQFHADGFGIVAPGLEIPAKRMKQHDTLGLSRKSSRTTERRHQEHNQPRSRADRTDVSCHGHALRKTLVYTRVVNTPSLRPEAIAAQSLAI
jgi:hypothetical protein